MYKSIKNKMLRIQIEYEYEISDKDIFFVINN
ncbi:hypothetical protein CNEO4_250166 [Clostridium neonatale]|nr:hypothetical protein CNEO4_250166 [Clostridium neonatale]